MSVTATIENYQQRFAETTESRSITAPTVVTVATSALLWVALLVGETPLPASAGGPFAAPGAAETVGLSNGIAGIVAYLLTWGALTTAIMLPAIVPLVREYDEQLDGRFSMRFSRLAILLASYAAGWMVVGSIPLAVHGLIDIGALMNSYGTVVLALGLIGAGVYQLSREKHRLLQGCSEDVDADDDESLGDAAGRGLDHAVRCVKCTWPLVALLVAFGTLNAVVLLAVCLVVTAERLPEWGREIAAAIGVAALTGGIAVLIYGIQVFA